MSFRALKNISSVHVKSDIHKMRNKKKLRKKKTIVKARLAGKNSQLNIMNKRIHSIGGVFCRTIHTHYDGKSAKKYPISAIIEALISTSLLGVKGEGGPAVTSSDGILLLSGGREVSFVDDSDEKLFLLHIPSKMGNKTVSVKMGRTSVDFPINRTVKDVGVELYRRNMTKVIPIEQKIIMNGKCIPSHMLLGDVALFSTGSKLNVTIVSSPLRNIAPAPTSTVRGRDVYRLQKMPKRKRSCGDCHRGLRSSRRPTARRIEPRKVHNVLEQTSPPVTPVK